jgi:hypothetical protein
MEYMDNIREVMAKHPERLDDIVAKAKQASLGRRGDSEASSVVMSEVVKGERALLMDDSD